MIQTKREADSFKIFLFEWRFYETLYKFTQGIYYLTTVLKEAGYPVWNYIFENKSVDEACEIILAADPDLVGVQFYREFESETFLVAKKLKKAKPDLRIMIGGHTATLFSSMILEREPAFDLAVYGEGEKTVLDLCERLREGRSPDDCRGIVYRQDGRILRTPPQDLIENLDELPMPDLDVYRRHCAANSPVLFTALSTSRGCTGSCTFCVNFRNYKNKHGKLRQYRARTPEHVLRELQYVNDAFPDKRIVYRVVDGSFEDPDAKNKARLVRLLDLIEAAGLKLTFTVLTRAESWDETDGELIERLKRLGLYQAMIGYEGGTQRSLEIFNKKARIEDNLRASRVFARHGVPLLGFLIMFHPYATLEDLKENAKFLRMTGDAYHPQAWWSELTLWPDARIFGKIVKDGLLLGPERIGYQYGYGYQDGRVGKVHKALQRLRDSSYNLIFRESMEKMLLENNLYNAWRYQYEEMAVIAAEMAEYGAFCRGVCGEVSEKAYGYFAEIVAGVEDRTFNQDLENRIMEAWINLYKDKQPVLEETWLQFRMRIGRKKVRLI
jgi:anaerobic magnesium-protoporphyrin IX monomethyl ester cyclase